MCVFIFSIIKKKTATRVFVLNFRLYSPRSFTEEKKNQKYIFFFSVRTFRFHLYALKLNDSLLILVNHYIYILFFLLLLNISIGFRRITREIFFFKSTTTVFYIIVFAFLPCPIDKIPIASLTRYKQKARQNKVKFHRPSRFSVRFWHFSRWFCAAFVCRNKCDKSTPNYRVERHKPYRLCSYQRRAYNFIDKLLLSIGEKSD